MTRRMVPAVIAAPGGAFRTMVPDPPPVELVDMSEGITYVLDPSHPDRVVYVPRELDR